MGIDESGHDVLSRGVDDLCVRTCEPLDITDSGDSISDDSDILFEDLSSLNVDVLATDDYSIGVTVPHIRVDDVTSPCLGEHA
jgi:hypothetical protein